MRARSANMADVPITEPAASEPVAHGGDLGAIRRRFPEAPQPWIDLSTGINPVAYPVADLPAGRDALLLQRYGHVRHMRIEAALRQQAAGQHAAQQQGDDGWKDEFHDAGNDEARQDGGSQQQQE